MDALAATVDGRSAAPRLAFAALVAGALAIAFSGILVKLSEVGPAATGFYRMGFAFPVYIAWMWLSPALLRVASKPVPKSPPGPREYALLIAAGVFFALDVATYNWALQFTVVANATLISNLCSVVVTIGAWLMFGERITRTFIIGMVLALTGITVLMGDSLRLSQNQLLGDGLSLGTALVYGAYLLIVARLRGRFGVVTIMVWTAGISTLLLLPMAVLGNEVLVPITAMGWIVVIGFALWSQVGGQGLIAYALAHLPASFASVSLLIQPVAAAFLAWGILGEALGWWQALGGVIVLAGIYLARRGSDSKPARTVSVAPP